MQSKMNDKANRDIGVYYRQSDYASLLKRIIAAGVDCFVLIILAVIISFIWPLFFEQPDFDIAADFGWMALAFFSPGFFWTCTIIAYCYLSIIKPSYLRTIGYRIAKLKIVNMKGCRPSLLQMTWRFLLLIFGPFHILIDLFWLGGGDDDRQALRDKMAGTYVVAANSLPVGSGPFKYANYNFLGFAFIFREVKRMINNEVQPHKRFEPG